MNLRCRGDMGGRERQVRVCREEVFDRKRAHGLEGIAVGRPITGTRDALRGGATCLNGVSGEENAPFTVEDPDAPWAVPRHVDDLVVPSGKVHNFTAVEEAIGGMGRDLVGPKAVATEECGTVKTPDPDLAAGCFAQLDVRSRVVVVTVGIHRHLEVGWCEPEGFEGRQDHRVR